MSLLFSPLTLRSVTARNRIIVSPMCQYSSQDGLPNDWHMVHLGSRAVGGAGIVIAEATAVEPEGRITPYDLGLWNDQQRDAFAPIVRFIRSQGAVPGIQLAHAGRKASANSPWRGGGFLQPEKGGWEPLAPSAIPFDASSPLPRAMTRDDMCRVIEQFLAATRRSQQAGFELIEIHMAHGYLLHEFLSPLSNRRTDDYGGSLANRMRFPLEVAEAIRAVWPGDKPLFVRISATDWAEGGWDVEQSVLFARELRQRHIDLIDCSSAALVPGVKIPLAPGYQVPFAARIRQDAHIATGAVGLITTPTQAEEILASGKADAILLARELLRDPYWPLHAARTLGETGPWPPAYGYAAAPRG